MQPNPPQPGPRANAAAAVIASVLALLTASMFVWFALYNIVVANDPTGRWVGPVVQNVLGGAVGAGVLLVAAGFTFIRRISGAWTLCVLCVLYVVATIFLPPLQQITSLGGQLEFIFGFASGADGVAVGMAVILCVLTAITAAFAASVKS